MATPAALIDIDPTETLFSTVIRGKPDLVRFIRHSGFSKTFRSDRFPIAGIQQIVASYYGLDSSQMTTPWRAPSVSHPRQVAMYLARNLTPHSFPEIGRRFGGKHHTTVLHAVREVRARMRVSQRIFDEVELLRQTILRAFG